ncbi:Nonribosomal peptide synthetase dtxS1 [Pseudocercospora fuligena]|uniref:Nonribosomal peptide synthetase dtxS1 n=1 Tax=Pseudocercospora fuligena TaxID=685502 RepID=A0A8H6RMU5_9PEZI|nr:Nonribosomal peptide synthetase dtxS1 [Pseudocercospora fuligena]
MSSDSFLCNWAQPITLLPLPVQQLTPDPTPSIPTSGRHIAPKQPRLTSLERNIMGDYGHEEFENDYVVVERRNSAAEFWKKYLSNLEAVQFPKLPGPSYLARPTATIEATFDGLGWESSAFRPGTFVHLAWAVLQARYTGSTDAAFVTKRGHSGLMAPSRIRINRNSKVSDILTAIQSSASEIDTHEHGGLDAIKAVNKCPDTPKHFQTMLGIHSHRSSSVTSVTALKEQRTLEESMFTLLIDCTVSLSSLSVNIRYDPATILSDQVRRLASQIGHVLRQILGEPQATLRDISLASADDIRDIWSWNGVVPQAKDACVHDLFMDVAMEQPDALAVDAWDGKMTYNELDQRSEQLAHHLADSGIGPGIVVPLCFEKSVWMTVTALSVMKAGAACLALDLSQPPSRLKSMLDQISISVIICSAETGFFCESLGISDVLVIDAAWFQTPRIHSGSALPRLRPSEQVFVDFTSSSSGRPKGVAISHSNASSWVHYWEDILRAGPSTRAYDATTPSTEMFWMNTILTLSTGGCLCVPSEDELSKSIDASIDRFESTLLHMTPAQASKVDFASTAHLETLFLAGQAAVKLDLPPHVRLLSGHGPLECTFAVTCANQSQLLLNEHSLGHRIGSNTWVVSDDGELCGIGEVGELWIEGPLVGLGYIGQQRETASAFVNDPHFITSGATGFPGRTGRFYKTGDLVWQQAGASLILVGRKDDQVNVHGHRVELGDIEHHVRDLLSPEEVKEVIVEFTTAHGGADPSLVAFIQPAGDFADTDWELDIYVKQLTNDVKEKLAQRLPAYMIPSRFVPCATMVKTSSGAVDRRRLREQAKNVSQPKPPSQHSDTKRSPSDPLSVLETQMSQLWGEILSISNRATITAESNFFALGGDSTAATRLTIAASKWGLAITVADVLKHPRLIDMAEHVKYAYRPSAVPETSHAINGSPSVSTMMNLYPLTPFQKRNLSGSLDQISKANDYLTFDIPSSLFISDIAQIVDNLIDHFDILRTVFIQIQDKYYQTIVSSYEAPMKVEETSSTSSEQILETIIKEDFINTLNFGQPWFQSYLIHEKHTNTKKLILRIHRALMDSTSISTLSSALKDLCAGRPLLPTPSWNTYLFQQSQPNSSSSTTYWQTLLHGGRMTYLPSSSFSSSSPTTTSLFASTTLPPLPANSSGTPSARFTASVALALSRLTGQSDILFGRLTRNSQHAELVGGVENFVPVRVNTHTANSTPSSSVIGGMKCIVEDVMGQMIEGMGMNEEGFDLEGLVAGSRSSSEVDVDAGEESMEEGAEESKQAKEEEFGVVAAFVSGPEAVRQIGDVVSGNRTVVFSAEVGAGKGSNWKVSVSASSDVQSQESLDNVLRELVRALNEV